MSTSPRHNDPLRRRRWLRMRTGGAVWPMIVCGLSSKAKEGPAARPHLGAVRRERRAEELRKLGRRKPAGGQPARLPRRP
jgi:hypothetical protein